MHRPDQANLHFGIDAVYSKQIMHHVINVLQVVVTLGSALNAITSSINSASYDIMRHRTCRSTAVSTCVNYEVSLMCHFMVFFRHINMLYRMYLQAYVVVIR